jgi:hypothetical protein
MIVVARKETLPIRKYSLAAWRHCQRGDRGAECTSTLRRQKARLNHRGDRGGYLINEETDAEI